MAKHHHPLPARVAVCGAAGRMGQAILSCLDSERDLVLGAAIEHSASPMLGMDALLHLSDKDKSGVKITSSLQALTDGFDVVVNFTLPDALEGNIDVCRDAKKPMVIGTTGLNEKHRQSILQASHTIPILLSPNMSIGVNLCFHLLDIAASVLAHDADIEITEAHHRHKKDAPSGTAMRMGEIIAKAMQRDLDEISCYSRKGTNTERKKGSLGFSVIRAGDIVGDHTVIFASDGERIEITHRASSRLSFARGALSAARWLIKQDPGLYDIQHVLGFGKND